MLVRLYIYIKKPQVLVNLLDKFNDLYNSNNFGKRAEVMQKCIQQIKTAFKLLFVCYLVSVSLFLINPLYDLIFLNQKTLIFPCELPFINKDTNTGFCITFAAHLIIEAYLLFGLSAIDGTFIFYAMQTSGMVGLFKLDLDELATDLTNQKSYNQKEMKAKLRQIIVNHKQFNDFVSEIIDFFYAPSYSVVVTSVFSVCSSLIAILFSGWYAALGFLIAVLYQLFITSLLGTAIDVQVGVVVLIFYVLIAE